jgi:hypothetical protein
MKAPEGQPIFELIERIEAIIKSSGRTGMVTFATEDWQQRFDVDPKTLVWGYDEVWRVLLLAKLTNRLASNGSSVGVTVRTFTAATELVRAANGKRLRNMQPANRRLAP